MRTTQSSFIYIALMSLSTLGWGCGDDGGDPPVDAAPDPDAAAVCGAELADPPPAANGDLNGTWALFSKFHSNVQGLGGAQITRSFYHHEYSQNGAVLALTETLCTIEIDAPDAGTTIRLGPGFVASQPQLVRAGTLTQAGDAYDFYLDPAYVARGVELTDLINDPLPTDANDPRVQDWDNDGNPGLTLLLDGILQGQLFEVQRDFTEFTGTQDSENRVTGLANWGSELVYLGAEPEVLLDVVNPALPDADPSRHTFQLVRLPAGSDCAYILENQCNLFTDIE